jgi:hypothetical protein
MHGTKHTGLLYDLSDSDLSEGVDVWTDASRRVTRERS